MKNHEILEKNIGLLTLFMILAVSIGGLTQIVRCSSRTPSTSRSRA